jgi:multiple antibiotic resistance protein
LALPVTAILAITVATVSTWLVMVLVARFARQQGDGGFMRDTLTRLMGLIVLSMGVQFALTGYHAFAP